MKPFWKSKTMWVAIIQAIMGTVIMLISQEQAVDALGVLMVVKSGIDAGLRFVTSNSITK